MRPLSIAAMCPATTSSTSTIENPPADQGMPIGSFQLRYVRMRSPEGVGLWSPGPMIVEGLTTTIGIPALAISSAVCSAFHFPTMYGAESWRLKVNVSFITLASRVAPTAPVLEGTTIFSMFRRPAAPRVSLGPTRAATEDFYG